jgi:hypothetical protein
MWQGMIALNVAATITASRAPGGVSLACIADG